MRAPMQKPEKLPCIEMCLQNERLAKELRSVFFFWQDYWAQTQDVGLWTASHQSWPGSSLAPSGRRTLWLQAFWLDIPTSPIGTCRPAARLLFVGRVVSPLQVKCRSLWRYINMIGVFFDIIHRPGFNLRQRFGDWILSPSSGQSLLSWGQSIGRQGLALWTVPK
jgi:hypothetical protein